MRAKVFTTTNCPACRSVKDFLKVRGVEFSEINIEDDMKAAEEMVEKSGQMSVPVVEIGEKIIVGFNRSALAEALGK